MSHQSYYQRTFTKRLEGLCSSQSIRPMECESVVTEWCETIDKNHRPTVFSIIMDCQRKMWGEETIHI